MGAAGSSLGLQRLDVAMYGALDGQGHERGRHGRDTMQIEGMGVDGK